MTDSLSDVRNEAKNAYKYWAIFLELQRRRVLKHVEAAALAASGFVPSSVVLGSDELSVLQNVGMPLPSDLSTHLLPLLIPIAASGRRFFFWSGSLPQAPDSVVLALVRLLPSGVFEAAELMRAELADSWYLNKAAHALNQALDSYGIDLTFNAAKLWASFHEGALVQPFVAVSAELVSSVLAPVAAPVAAPIADDNEDDFRVEIVSFRGEDDW